MTPHDVSLLLYNIALLPVLFFSVLFFVLSVLSISSSRTVKTKLSKERPTITVQIPSFNDPVAARCIEACLRFTYPKSRYEIMILDDSTDKSTQKLLRSYAKKYPSQVKYIHRTNRSGYKPGALQAVLPQIKSELCVVFDADFVPQRDFLERISTPFEDPKVAIVQGRQGFLNKDVNLVSRFAAYLLMIHHTILIPMNTKANAVLFCGTGGALRTSAIREAGGWNPASITEDTELSLRILQKGYKTMGIAVETPSEVPVTLEGFFKQQMRWTFGNIRAWIDHSKAILFKRGLTLRQRLLITYMTCGTIISPVVIFMTLAGFSGWFTGDPQLTTMADLSKFIITMLVTGGFIILGTVTLVRRKELSDFPQFVLSVFSVSLLLAAANTVAIYKAIFRPNKPLFSSVHNSWICTPKTGNNTYGR